MSSSLDYTPQERWEFDEEVAACFDDMLARSIPQYEAMRQLTAGIACLHMRPATCVIDLGCSHGETIDALLSHNTAGTTFHGYDNSPAMLERARERFEGERRVFLRECDLRYGMPQKVGPVSVIMSILTLQFVPVEFRMRILEQVHAALEHRGVFIFVEKVVGQSSEIDQSMVEAYYALKRANGYKQKDIDDKRAALENVMVPLRAKDNESMLVDAGFTQVDCFWRWMNFAGWLAIK